MHSTYMLLTFDILECLMISIKEKLMLVKIRLLVLDGTYYSKVFLLISGPSPADIIKFLTKLGYRLTFLGENSANAYTKGIIVLSEYLFKIREHRC